MLHYSFSRLLVANPNCLGWENKQPLLRKCRSYNQHLLLSASTPLIVVTNAGLDRIPSSCLARLFRQSESMSEWQKYLCQGYLTIHTSAWSSVPDHPPFLERDYPLVDQTHIYRNVFNKGATDWRFFIVIMSRTNVLFVRLDFVSGSCAQETWCSELWRKGSRNRSVAYQVPVHSSKLSKHPHHNCLLTPRVWTIMELHQVIGNIQYIQYSRFEWFNG